MTVETQLPADWTEGFVAVDDGVRLHYARTGGDGPPLVVAHGVFDDGLCRTPLARDLEADYDVILYDARGHGQSDAPESGYGPGDRAADLVGLLDGLDVADPILFGHSMGGDTVLATAANYPDLPRAVVAVDPASLLEHNRDNRGDSEGSEGDGEDGGGDSGDGDSSDGLDEERIEGVREQILWWHDHSKAELLVADDELAGHVDAGEEELASRLADARLGVSANITEVFRSGWLDPETDYSAIEAPTLVLRADVDETARERDRAAVDLIDDGRLVHVDGTGHCVFRDEREVATRELREFLDGI